MSAPPHGAEDRPSGRSRPAIVPPRGGADEIPGQDETHERIRALLAAAGGAVLAAQPALRGLADHRPQRDRSSGAAWHGVQTLCHVSALLASAGPPDPSEAATDRLLVAVDRAVAPLGMRRRSARTTQGVLGATWSDDRGDLLDVVVGVRVAVRAISAPFLPGSLRPARTTSPSTPLSAAARPARTAG